ncbi:LOW QUALITY PROTEIN: spindle assembly abnormal protein 6 homolog [Haliotis rubra]|uniref:LOW QUALITY PROTEIN: spindle assembly abnormal protein 6 homolog n=1 Tax=Haliotis rubra TaxID=36100 RepID=UPI001EE619EB|nr:LOW QUALITY PROTEIN: spindle assembly abnormal protein 6 homolog [Haliotis rubra]
MADELFSKRLPVVVKSADREERKVSLHLRMELQAITSPLHRKELVVRLTDESDLFFLYTLRLGEEDFQSLKVQQGLLVDFGAFPQKFIDLLEMCVKEEHKDVPKFILQFVSQGSLSEKVTGMLNIVETNPFKHLTHLSLKFIPGQDADVKKYLADCLKQLKETNGLLQQRLEHTHGDLSQRLQATQESLASKSSELESLKTEWTSRLVEVTSRHKEEMASEKERSLQIQGGLQQRFDRERKELEQAHAKIVKQLDSRLYEVEGVSKDLTDRKYKSESTVRELKSKLSTLEEEHTRAKQEVQTLRKQNASMDSDYHEQGKLVNQLQTRIAVMEQELKDKEQVLSKSSDLLGSEQEKKRKYEEDLDRKHKDISKLEGKVKAMSEELMKGNEIIKKLQEEVKSNRAKVKLRTQIATDRRMGQDRSRESQDLAGTKDRRPLQENRRLSESVETTTKKLEESRQLLKTNENVIQWLNKQINEQQLTHHRVGAFEMPSAASTMVRPGGTALHNYSTSSYGSAASHHSDSHVMQSGVGIPRQYPHRQPQVQYNPGNPRRSGLPMPVGPARPGPPPPIPEEIRPQSNHSSPASNADKENDPPIDPKFLQKREDAIPVRGLLNRSNSPPLISNTAPPHPSTNSVRISQQMIVPRTVQAPLASAYFPGQSKAS